MASRYEGSAGHEFAHKGVGPDVNDKAGHTYHRCEDVVDDDGNDDGDDDGDDDGGGNHKCW